METMIKNAVAHYEQLLREQIARAENLNAAKKQKDENKTVMTVSISLMLQKTSLHARKPSLS